MIVVRLFGVEVLAFGREEEDAGPGDVTTSPVGFAQVLDTRYQPPPGGHVE